MCSSVSEESVLLARLKRLVVGAARAERRRVRALGAPGREVAAVVHRCQCLSCDSIECSSKQIGEGKGGTVTQVEITRETTRGTYPKFSAAPRADSGVGVCVSVPGRWERLCGSLCACACCACVCCVDDCCCCCCDGN